MINTQDIEERSEDIRFSPLEGRGLVVLDECVFKKCCKKYKKKGKSNCKKCPKL